MKRFVLFALSLILSLFAIAQDFPKYQELMDRSERAANIKKYDSAIYYYLESLRLPSMQRPAATSRTYYDLACYYSLNRDSVSAIQLLDKSFSLGHSQEEKTPVSAWHLARDRDLVFVRPLSSFKLLARKYYKPSEGAFLTSNEISYVELMEFIKEELRHGNGGVPFIEIRNKTIYWEKSPNGYVNNEGGLEIPEFAWMDKVGVEFHNCHFQLNLHWNNTGNTQNQPVHELLFDSCHFYGNVTFGLMKFHYLPDFTNCKFDKSLLLLPEASDEDMFILEGNQLSSVRVKYSGEKKGNLSFKNNTSLDSSDVWIQGNQVGRAEIEGNRLGANNVRVIFNSVDMLRFENNQFGNLLIVRTKIEEEFHYAATETSGHVILKHIYIPESPASDVDWTLFGKGKLGIFESQPEDIGINNEGALTTPKITKPVFRTGEKVEDIEDAGRFRELIGVYSQFLNMYKTKNDIESYNACFISVKELQELRLKYLAEKSGTFESYFRWKLSQLLKVYVRYGTDPANAIVISIYIIICFGIFFFFFPSDWDTTSKARLLNNFKDFIHKNDKGYVKPFFILAAGFGLSLLNALTLSLNAFITLGFGNIPTHGLARYFCVLEGFFGWFLLSIFTVALINQTL